MGMTMKREAKTRNLTEYAERRSGQRVERSFSPRQLAKYGRYLPADFAAKFWLSYHRETRKPNREFWAADRAARRVRWTNAAGRTVCRGAHHSGDTQYCRTVR